MEQGDTISAIATAAGPAGIGIVRLSGEGAIAVASRIFEAAGKISLASAPDRRVTYGRVKDMVGNTVDEALAIVMRSPHSYTREDVVEIQSHGGGEVLRKILALTYEAGARPAEAGEFTKRAFLNGRLDLSQAQAVMDVITARTEEALKVAAGQLKGNLSQKIQGIRQNLLALIAHLEVNIDFPEEDIAERESESLRQDILRQSGVIDKLLMSAGRGKILREGLTTAIVGKPNVGKSSLLNALLGERRAIVTDLPGTTRDIISEYANLGGLPLKIIDTAGIRDSRDEIEKIGVERAKEWIEAADLILAVFDSSRPLTEEDEAITALLKGHRTLIVLNKCDLPAALTDDQIKEQWSNIPRFFVSAREEKGLEELGEAVSRLVYDEKSAGDLGETPLVSHERQIRLLKDAKESLTAALGAIDAGLGADFVVIDLKEAWEKLGEITGDTVGEDIIEEIFAKFCLGK